MVTIDWGRELVGVCRFNDGSRIDPNNVELVPAVGKVTVPAGARLDLLIDGGRAVQALEGIPAETFGDFVDINDASNETLEAIDGLASPTAVMVGGDFSDEVAAAFVSRCEFKTDGHLFLGSPSIGDLTATAIATSARTVRYLSLTGYLHIGYPANMGLPAASRLPRPAKSTTVITDSGLGRISSMRELERLALEAHLVTTEGAGRLLDMPALSFLDATLPAINAAMRAKLDRHFRRP